MSVMEFKRFMLQLVLCKPQLLDLTQPEKLNKNKYGITYLLENTQYTQCYYTEKEKMNRRLGLILLELSKYKRNTKGLCTDVAKYWIFIFWQVLNMQPT